MFLNNINKRLNELEDGIAELEFIMNNNPKFEIGETIAKDSISETLIIGRKTKFTKPEIFKLFNIKHAHIFWEYTVFNYNTKSILKLSENAVERIPVIS